MPSPFESASIELDDLLERVIPPSRRLLGPFLDPTISLIHSMPGVGKSLVAHEVAISVASGETRFGGKVPDWRPSKDIGKVLIIDGEMPLNALQSRMATQLDGRSAENIILLTNAELSVKGHELIQINKQESREALSEYIESIDNLRLVVLDNLTTLVGPGFDEDSSASARPINKWFMSMRYQGISVILIHHDNKRGDQRGSSDRSSICDLVMHLAESPLKDGKQAHFNLEYKKARWLESSPEPFTAKMVGRRWMFRSKEDTRVDELLGIMEIVGRWNWKDVAMEMQISKSRVYALRSLAKDRGWWDDEWDHG